MKVISMLSGGIDSPVATYLALQAGLEVTALHMDNRPFTDDREVEKTRTLAAHIARAADAELPLYLAAHGANQTSIARFTDTHLQCLLCRRQMYRTAVELAHRIGAQAIVNGESLGQVASQTLTNLQAIDAACSLPILRPLIGLDKIEIERIARRIGTLEISTLPSLCCSIVPDKPATGARLGRVLAEEAKLDLERMSHRALEHLYEVQADRPTPVTFVPGGS